MIFWEAQDMINWSHLAKFWGAQYYDVEHQILMCNHGCYNSVYGMGLSVFQQFPEIKGALIFGKMKHPTWGIFDFFF